MSVSPREGDVPLLLDVLFRDETLLAVQKPSGLLVHNSAYAGPRETTVTDLVRAQVARDAVPLHRLDRGTSGVLLFASSSEHAGAWSTALSADGTRKLYMALVRGHLDAAVNVDHPVKDEDGVSRPARSIVRPLARSAVERCSLVEVELLTGRTHQARRHLQHLSHPVIGDTTYGRGDINRHHRARWGIHRLCLHASRVELLHPFSGGHVEVEAPLTADLLLPFTQLLGDVPAPSRQGRQPAG